MNPKAIYIQCLIAATLTFCLISAKAAEVLQVSKTGKVIAITKEDGRVWKLRDSVCVYQIGVEAACGSVVKLIKQGAVVKLKDGGKPIEKGDSVGLVKTNRSRRTASEIMDSTSNRGSGINNWEVSAGVGGGSTYFFPVVNVQRRVTPNIAVGLTPFFVSSSTTLSTVTAFGGFLTGNYYLKSPYEGLSFQVGLGAVSFSINSSGVVENSASFAALATVGYRFEVSPSISIGVALGGLYVSPVASSVVIISLSGALPYGTADVGFTF